MEKICCVLRVKIFTLNPLVGCVPPENKATKRLTHNVETGGCAELKHIQVRSKDTQVKTQLLLWIFNCRIPAVCVII
jgi:hypothetical protein